ncbi:MAG: hypothetical protein LAN63_12750 [Acidobacteriia bacterium]|nr:hypothetical protein [Terriglobia bacterium]
MKNDDQEKIRFMLKKAFPPVDPAPRRDLWPAVLRRLGERGAATPWYDWAMAAVLVGLLVAFPKFIPVLFYHL